MATTISVFTATILIIAILLGIGLVLLGVRIFFIKGGRFPNTHISGNKHLREQGISCAQSQDRNAQKNNNNKINIKDL